MAPSERARPPPPSNPGVGFKVGSVDSAAMHGRNKWHRLLDEMHEQRMKQQKIQRLMLDTSGRGQSNFYKLHPDRAPGGDAPVSVARTSALSTWCDLWVVVVGNHLSRG
eukprot:1160804-Pelagomonas_calceolata.AAC.17